MCGQFSSPLDCSAYFFLFGFHPELLVVRTSSTGSQYEGIQLLPQCLGLNLVEAYSRFLGNVLSSVITVEIP